MNPIFADSAKMRRSQAAAITAPAPTATPFTAAMTGRRSSRIDWMSAPVMRVKSRSARMSREKTQQ